MLASDQREHVTMSIGAAAGLFLLNLGHTMARYDHYDHYEDHYDHYDHYEDHYDDYDHYDHYTPHYRRHLPDPAASVPLQTHDRSLVDPAAPHTVSYLVTPNCYIYNHSSQILNPRDFSEDNPFTVPAGVRGLDAEFQRYLSLHVNVVGISSAVVASRDPAQLIVNRNSRRGKNSFKLW